LSIGIPSYVERFSLIIFFRYASIIHTLFYLIVACLVSFHEIQDCQHNCRNKKETNNNGEQYWCKFWGTLRLWWSTRMIDKIKYHHTKRTMNWWFSFFTVKFTLPVSILKSASWWYMTICVQCLVFAIWSVQGIFS
jgi:hypothetical protein